MDAIVESVNGMGEVFVRFALAMLIQSSVLIVILFGLDWILRKRVRAVFRYGLWMLVLVKLLLPTTLAVPTGVGYWIGGDFLGKVTDSRISPYSPATTERTSEIRGIAEPERASGAGQGRVVPKPMTHPPAPTVAPTLPTPEAPSPSVPAVRPITWEGIVLLVWFSITLGMLVLLIQRSLFVKKLIVQARDADPALARTLDSCRIQGGLRKRIRIKLSPDITSPAVCGLVRPVVLIPQELPCRLNSHHLKVVLMHELGHIKRFDLWVSLIQHALQVVYFYNPLLWLANTVIRRVREQAVDEAVLATMHRRAEEYPQALIRVARLAVTRPVLSLRLIGVVESKGALYRRVQHILRRPIPKKAKLGLVGFLLVLIGGAVLLPMAKGQSKPAPDHGASNLEKSAAPAEKTITYKGVVKDETGKPIAGVSVQSNLTFHTPYEFRPGEAKTKTDDEGRFEIGPLPVPDRRKAARELIFDHPRYALGWFRPNVGREVDPKDVRITLLNPAPVTGTVTDKKGNPIEGATVTASLQLALDSYRYFGYRSFAMTRANNLAVTTDARGRFVLERIPEPARAHVFVVKPGYVRYSTRDGYRSDGYPIRTAQDLTITLERGGVIKGRLMFDRQPYKKKGIQVLAIGSGGRTLAYTDDNGAFEIAGLREGSYRVLADNNALAEDNVVCPPRSNVIVKAGAGATQVELGLRKGVPVTMQVIDTKSRKPVPESLFSIALKEDEKVVVRSGRMDSQGRRLVHLTPGEYAVRVTGWKNGRGHRFSKDCHVAPDSKEVTFEIAVGSRPNVRGQLVDSKSQPVRGTVHLGGGEGSATDEKGRFSIPEPSVYDPMHVQVGYAFDTNKKLGRGFLWKKSEDEGKYLKLVLEPLASIVGQIMDQEGTGIGDAEVGIDVHLGGGISQGTWGKLWKTTYHKDGRFSFEGIPVGLRISVSARKPGHAGGVELGEMTPGEVSDTAVIVLKPPRGFEEKAGDWTGTLSGRVIDERGKPMVGRRVYISVGTTTFQDRTDMNGRYTLTGLPKGKKLRVKVYAAGYGHCSGVCVPGQDDFDIQIFPQGYELYGKQAPGLFVERWLNTKPITLDQLRGKVVLLQIGVLLPHYSQELERMEKLLKKYGSKGLTVVAVHQPLHVTWAGRVTEEMLSEYIKKYDIKFAFGIDAPTGEVADMVPQERRSSLGAMYSLYDAKAFPALYLIDKTGKVRISPTRENLDRWVRKLLAEQGQQRRHAFLGTRERMDLGIGSARRSRNPNIEVLSRVYAISSWMISIVLSASWRPPSGPTRLLAGTEPYPPPPTERRLGT